MPTQTLDFVERARLHCDCGVYCCLVQWNPIKARNKTNSHWGCAQVLEQIWVLYLERVQCGKARNPGVFAFTF